MHLIALLASASYAYVGPVASNCPLGRSSAPMFLRGGSASASVEVASHAKEAIGLFGNMGGKAAFLAGGLVPLSLFAGPAPAPDDPPMRSWLKRAHQLITASSLLSLLVSVMYSAIAINQLTENSVAPTVSLRALLLSGKFALLWTGCNAHLFLGLFGLATAIAIHIWLKYGGSVGKAVMFSAASAVSLMLSVVNDAIAAHATDMPVGGSVVSLLLRYISLLLKAMVEGRRILTGCSLACTVAAIFFSVQALVSDYWQPRRAA